MRIYRPGALPWDETQAIYHALAQTGGEGLVLCRPASRCVCLGMHDDLTQEVDEDYCRLRDIPLIRREIGGGTVLLDRAQLFFQLVLRANHPLLAGARHGFFARFLQPAVRTLADFGLSAAIRAPADILVAGRKISGNGAGDIHGMAVFTGNILLGFDRTTMAGVLRLPDESSRQLLLRLLEQHLTTMSEELGNMPDIAAVEDRLANQFAAWLGELEPAEYSLSLRQQAERAAAALTDREFLALPGRKTPVREVKLREGAYLRLDQAAGDGLAELAI